MGRNDRIIKLIAKSYRVTFRTMVNSYLEQWNSAYSAGRDTSHYSASDCLASAHRIAWNRAYKDASSRYGHIFGLESWELACYYEALSVAAPKEWYGEFAAKPIPQGTIY
jgi:hypothetical protein